jgi:hypothetical protein
VVHVPAGACGRLQVDRGHDGFMGFRPRIVHALEHGARDAHLLRKECAIEADAGHDAGEKRTNNGESSRIHDESPARLM